MNKGGFSWKKFVGISQVKSNISKKIGIPLTKSGRNQKVGRIISKGCFGIFSIILFSFVLVLIALVNI